MTRIRELLLAFRNKRSEELLNAADTLSFDSFRTDVEKPSIYEKESTLINNINILPVGKNNGKCSLHNQDVSVQAGRSSLFAFILVTIVVLVFLLPVFYLQHFFSAFYYKHSLQWENKQQHFDNNKLIITHIPKLPNEPKGLPPPPKPDYAQCKLLNDSEKFDCFPDNGASADACEARGCCWLKPQSKMEGDVPLNIPYCFYPPNYESYTYVNVTETAYGLSAFLRRKYRSPYLNDVEVIRMDVRYETSTRLHIKFVDPLHNRFETPYPEVPVADKAAADLQYNIVIDPLNTGFTITRRSDNSIIFDSSNLQNMIFADQFLQLSSRLPSKYIYGLGEHRSSFLLSTQWQRFTLFNHDSPPRFNTNLYGSQPFYLLIEPFGNTHGVLLLNSNAMDIILQPTPAITFRTIGGVLNFYFFLGPSPSDVISQYTDLVGRPTMPPFWALGFHLCRFGYKTLNNTAAIMQRNIDAGIPIDTQWNDLDYMDNSNDFTYDKINFKGLPAFVKDLHKRNIHYIVLIDPGISASELPGTYPPYGKGIEMDIFVKNSSNLPLIGKVWNRATTVWPDFTNPNTVNYWTLMLKSLHDQVPFDGAWIDMNDPSNFLSGSFSGCPKSPLENPPYTPAVDGGYLNYKTLCMTAKHYVGLHYNVHNLYGIAEAIVTNFAMADIRGKRPMIISRSTFVGQGHFGGHWSGDVFSTWEDMKYSIPQLLSFSLFGIPLMGADICGFNGNTTAALCNRWMQLGAFYPFSRNHNTDDGIDQDPVALGELVVKSSKQALAVRYSLLSYLYTLFWEAHSSGTTVVRPLFFEFINDTNTYGIDEQFLWGSSLMIIPVLKEENTFVTPYIPEGVWYDFYSRTVLRSTGATYNLSAPLDTIPLLIRGGHILTIQNPKPTTAELRNATFEILAALDENGEASGKLYWDDGDSLNTFEENRYCLIEFYLESDTLRSNVVWWATDIPSNVSSVAVLGVETPVINVEVNEVSVPFEYDTVNKYLSIKNLDLLQKEPFVISWK